MAHRDKVLVVDDDADVRETLLSALLQAGYLVDSARNGFEALAHIGTSPAADLVLSDVQMPGMTGLELIQSLRERGFRQPVVLVTGGPTGDICTGANSYGATACLTKPLNLDELVWAIECALACRRARPTA